MIKKEFIFCQDNHEMLFLSRKTTRRYLAEIVLKKVYGMNYFFCLSIPLAIIIKLVLV